MLRGRLRGLGSGSVRLGVWDLPPELLLPLWDVGVRGMDLTWYRSSS